MLIALILALTQQPDTFVTDAAARPIPANRPTYVITAKLDEERQLLEGHAWMTYANARPDTLRELYFHQYLNAFRPGSKWSERDAREGRVRFQNLKEPNYGYERFTAPPKVNGVPVAVEYPGAPDSTVVKLVLDKPVMPGDTILVEMRWDARPSTVVRRQGRRGRSWDFAQWYPKIAVIDNGGWEPNALVPAGELYGEFGDYDVTMILRDDQVVGGTGIVVEGDPGWARVSKGGTPYMTSTIGMALPGGVPLQVDVPPGYRKVRFHADDVHHFAFSVSPDYRYEGGIFVRQQRVDAGTRSPGMQPGRKAAWDTVAIHVLYRKGDEAQWGSGAAVGRTRVALEWLQRVYGDYAYPQLTNLHRLDGGGTEFPMAIMDGSASQGLILHEGGHVYTYGILANNEWRSGWMDEGLTSYQTSWASGNTPQDRAQRGGRDSIPRQKGYRGLLRGSSGIDRQQMSLYRLDLIGRTEPIGTRADLFSEFGIYNTMIYDRAEMMYGALRDAVGDSAFTRFLRGYYRDWRFLHVDERAMRTSVEREAGVPLGWFFDQWLRHPGLVDYALKKVTKTRAADGTWITRGRVVRTGDYHHPMPLGALTHAGWVIARGNALEDDQWIEVRTSEKPLAVRLDPLRTTEDWDRRNDVARRFFPPKEELTARNTLDLPFLDQTDRDHFISAYAPIAWTSTANGFVGGIRVRSGYQNAVDLGEFGIVRASRDRPVSAVIDTFPMVKGIAYTRPLPQFGIPALPVEVARPYPNWLTRTPYWWTLENPRLPWENRPRMGLRTGVWSLDGVLGAELGYSWDASPFYYAKTRTTTRSVRASVMTPLDIGFLPARWQSTTVTEINFAEATRLWRGPGPRLAYSAALGYATKGPASPAGAFAGGAYARGTLALQVGRSNADSSVVGSIRLFGGASTERAPLQRRLYASSQDPYETFSSNLVRPAGGLLAQPDAHFVPLGGAGLRAYDPRLPLREVAAVNVETAQRLATLSHTPKALTLWASVFGDAGVARLLTNQTRTLADAGVGLSLRGWFYDREVRLRLDAPLVMTNQDLAVGDPKLNGKNPALRWQFSLTDIW